MAVNLGNWEVMAPNNNASAVLEIPADLEILSSKGGALMFLHRSNDGSTQITHIFSPIGYTLCTLTQDQKFYEVLPTFGMLKPITIQASFVDISDEDGTAMFENYDGTNGSKWPVAFIPRGAYVWIRYAGAVNHPGSGRS